MLQPCKKDLHGGGEYRFPIRAPNHCWVTEASASPGEGDGAVQTPAMEVGVLQGGHFHYLTNLPFGDLPDFPGRE